MNEKKETRAGKYGRNLALVLDYILEAKKESYRREFLKEIKNYSLEPRKEGSPKSSGCVNELENIENLDMNNPQHLARLVKEGIHLMYQKQTSKRVLDSLLENL